MVLYSAHIDLGMLNDCNRDGDHYQGISVALIERGASPLGLCAGSDLEGRPVSFATWFALTQGEYYVYLFEWINQKSIDLL